jgi:hypothetical protein
LGEAKEPMMHTIRYLVRQVAALAAVATAIALLAWSPMARADIPPSCDIEASLITCAAADVGKPCQGGGKCYAVSCVAGGSTTASTLYKCDACPTVLPPPDGGCSPANFGTPCGDGGTCSSISSWCAASSKYVCSVPAAAQPTGPPAGEPASGTGTGSGGGCGIVSAVPTTAGIAAGLIAIGLALLAMGSRRRPR